MIFLHSSVSLFFISIKNYYIFFLLLYFPVIVRYVNKNYCNKKKNEYGESHTQIFPQNQLEVLMEIGHVSILMLFCTGIQVYDFSSFVTS